MQQLKSCGVLVFRDEPSLSFLLMEHTQRLDLPKGHVDPGESEIECALRELEEETGIASSDIDLDPQFRFTHCYTVRYQRTNNQEMGKTLVVFLGRLKRDVDINISEHIGFRWVPWNPPHHIQQQTIDPLLKHVAEFLDNK